MQSGKRIISVEDCIRIFAAQIVFHVFARQGGAAADYRKLQLLRLQVLDHVLHLQRGLHQQAAQPNCVGIVLFGGGNDRVRRLLDPQVHDPVAVVGENDVNQIFADVVDVALHGSKDD